MAVKTIINNSGGAGTTGDPNVSSPNFAWTSLIPAVVSLLAGGLFGGSSSSTSISGNSTLDPQIRALLSQQQKRSELQNPLYEEVTQLARSLLPRSSRPASYVLPTVGGSTSVSYENPAPMPDAPVLRTTPDAPSNNSLTNAVRMMASGISPNKQATLFRR